MMSLLHPIPLIWILLGKPGAAFDVGEQEGDGAGWQALICRMMGNTHESLSLSRSRPETDAGVARIPGNYTPFIVF